MAFSTQRATSDGTLSLLDISIEYFDRSEIAVLYDGVLQTSGWSWIGTTDKKISFAPPVPNGVEVMLVRTTDLESVRHVFTLGAAFTTQSLDEDLKQILHIAQEAKENATIEEVFHNLNMHGYRLVNVGPGIADTDGANMAQMNTAVGMAQAAAVDAANSAATINVANLLSKAANLSDVANAGTARSNLGAQATLVSGTNIKTVNGNSLVGSGDVALVASVTDGDKGDIVVSGGGSVWTVEPGLIPPFLTSRVAISTTAGASHDYTGIPAWVKRITFMLSGVSTSGAASVMLQLGSSAGIETSGYVGSVDFIEDNNAGTTYSTGILLDRVLSAGDSRSGLVTLCNVSGNLWVCNGMLSNESTALLITAGRKSLAGTLDRIRLTTSNGTDTFDAGTFNILYE